MMVDGVALATDSTPAPVWPDTFESRLEVLALLETLNADLLGHDSATLTLERWCAAHGLGTPPEVLAERDRGVSKPPDDAVRRALAVGPDEPVGYRRVRLRCGERVLSEADNWYVPGRLTPAMNRELETTDVSFGRVVRSLGFARHTLSARLLWQPLPEGWEGKAELPPPLPSPLPVPPFVLEHRAVLLLPDGTPFSHVVESYTRAVLDFPFRGP